VSHSRRVDDRRRHASDDEVLRETARILRVSLRPADLCCRIGGDVFMILLPDTDAEGARLVMTRLRAEVFRTGARHDTPIGISLGAASWPDDGDDGVALLRKADAAVCLEKRRQAARERRRPTGFGHPLALVK
jgi:diguanylate cyclase (GGDEF)-like protein